MTRVLLLGGTGFLGQAVRAALEVDGAQVTTVARSTTADVRIDATDLSLVAALLGDGPDVVVNLLGAGLAAGSADPETMTAVNALFPSALYHLLAEQRPQCLFVHAASSTERLPDQTADESEYSRTKHEGSERLRAAVRVGGPDVRILTIHNTYGPGQPAARFVAATIARLRSGEGIALAYPDRIRDFVLVSDVASAIAAAAQGWGPVEQQVGTGIGTSLRDAALTIAEVLGQPSALVTTGTAPLADPNPVTVCPVVGGTLGLCATGFRDGIRRTLREH